MGLGGWWMRLVTSNPGTSVPGTSSSQLQRRPHETIRTSHVILMRTGYIIRDVTITLFLADRLHINVQCKVAISLDSKYTLHSK